MNQSQAPIASATRTLKTLSLATRLLLWLVLVAWALLALSWGALHGWILPRIDQWRPDLERWATRAVGVPVRVGAIRAESGHDGSGWLPAFLPGLAPTLELSDVQLLDPQGREALRLPQVRATLSPRSIWRLGFEQVRIDAPVLEVRRTAQGRIEVAGLDFSAPGGDDRAVADWFFAQPEFAIHNGTLRWTDELRGQPPLALSTLHLVLRNSARQHDFRLDATPPADWGQRLSLRGQLREPLLPLRLKAALQASAATPPAPPWQDWSGQLYAELPHADVSQLQRHVDLTEWGLDVSGGRGALRLWADMEQGRIAGITADLALQSVQARLGAQLAPLSIDALHGRLIAQWGEAGWEMATEELRFRTASGQVWPGGRASLRHANATAARAASSALAAERIDLGALAAIATHLPLASSTHAWLQRLQPQGQVLDLAASWQGALGSAAYQAKGRVQGLALTGEDSGQTSSFGPYPLPGRPGIRGAAVDFDFDRDGGRAQLQVKDGALELPGVFEERLLPLQTLQADARWTVQGERIEVQLERLSLANADTQGTGQARWHTSDAATSPSGSRFPGVLDLKASLTRADATRIHRYLPLTAGAEARRYLQAAVRSGQAEQVDFRVQGELWNVPFNEPGAQGEFRITARLSGVDLDYVPTYLQSPGDAAWPSLRGAQGDLVLDRAALQLTGLQAGLEGAPNLRLGQASVSIADLAHTSTLVVNAQAQGPASEVLGFVRRSPVHRFTSQALAQAQISGSAPLQFRVDLPLFAIQNTRVSGTVQLAGNDVRITPDSPLLGRASGTLAFSESGFAVSGAQARLYGGDVQFEGGLAPDAQGQPQLRFRGQGSASAEALRDADLGFVSRLFGKASGSAAYTAQLGFRAGEPELLITSNLLGMALPLPAPLGKAAAESLPMRLETRVLMATSGLDGELPLTDRLRLDIGPVQQPLLALHYERDISGPEARVLRGSIAAGLGGGEAAPLPASGVVANVHTALVDVEAWERAFASATGISAGQHLRADLNAVTEPATSASLSYLPTSLALRTDRLTLDGRSFHRVVLGASREGGGPWRANIEADELEGYVEYRLPSGNSAGSVFARLARLTLAPGAAREVEQILQQPTSVPALDIAVEELTVANRPVGRIQIEALNRSAAPRQREWRLTQFRLDVPEARLSATGNWVATAPGAARRTALNFTLDVDDAGLLLGRLGREGVVRGGKGRIEGNVGWLGSPLSLDYASLGGQVKADIERGQFLKVEPGAAKLLGVLSLQALPRRLLLDFRDVFSEGFAFDYVRGDARIEQGVLKTNNLQMKGVNAAVLMEGSADLARETQDLNVLVVPDLNPGTVSLLATAVNPVVGLGSFLAQLLLRQPLQSATTQQFHITGGWADPVVEKK